VPFFSRILDQIILLLPQRVWGILAFIDSLLILRLGLQAPKDLPRVSLPPGTDKVIHFVMYASLAACLFRWQFPLKENGRSPGPFAALWVLLIPMAVGALDEILQGHFSGRTQDFYDWVADASAGLVVLMIGLYYQRQNKKLQREALSPDFCDKTL
jgi:VanZ family protein